MVDTVLTINRDKPSSDDGCTVLYQYQKGCEFLNSQPFSFTGIGQDAWRSDTSGVEYFHIFGRRKRPDTVEQVVATPVTRNPASNPRTDFKIEVKMGVGDRTVPRLRAERCRNFICDQTSGNDLNAPNGTVVGFFAENRAESKLYEHTGLVKAPEVLNTLGLPVQSLTRKSTIHAREDSMKIVTRSPNALSKGAEPPLGEGYYVTIVGVERLEILDDLGNTNTPIGDAGFELSVPGVGYSGGIYSESVNVGYHDLDLPANEGSYTVKFRTGTDSIDIEVLKGVGNSSPNMAIRYIDLDLPPNVDCILTFNPQGVPDLAYDSNGDGTFDTVVPAHVRVTGTAAQDVTAPAVTLTYSKRTGGSGRVITINAADAQSGVQTVYYRIGETGSFKIYEGPFTVSAITEKVIEAFADDNVGNRSSPIRVIVPKFATFE